MTDTLTQVEFRPLTIPESVDADDAADFLEMVRVRNIVYREISGHGDESVPADELLPNLRPDDYRVLVAWVVVDSGSIVGRVMVELPSENDSKVAFWRIELLRKVWGRGIGAAAYALVEETAQAHGRTVLQAWAEHPATGATMGKRIAPPTGFGEIPEDHAARFFLRHGYSLEQVERNSAFDLTASFGRVEELQAEAQAASKDRYRVVQWFPPTPAEYAAGYAWMKSRMITDAPSADLDFDEEAWDAARVAQHDAKYTDVGCLLLVTAAQHIDTGELCAFNELTVGKDRREASHQEDTLVLKEHRGHKLGTLVKCAGLLRWRELAPDSPRVLTYNAEENRPMLDINEAIGFAPIAYVGAWKKVLDE